MSGHRVGKRRPVTDDGKSNCNYAFFHFLNGSLLRYLHTEKKVMGIKVDTERQSDSLIHPHFLNLIFIGMYT